MGVMFPPISCALATPMSGAPRTPATGRPGHTACARVEMRRLSAFLPLLHVPASQPARPTTARLIAIPAAVHGIDKK